MKVEDALTELQNSDDTTVSISFELNFVWKNRFAVLAVLKRIFRYAEVNSLNWNIKGEHKSLDLQTNPILLRE